MPQSPYDQIAELYDVFVQTTLDVPFFVSRARETQGEILELMAGTGRVTLPLVEAGARVTCVDNAGEMLALLRDKLAKRGLSADVHQMDVRRLAFDKRFDLILIPFHAFAELPTHDDQLQTLEGIYAHLAEGGRFICAMHNPPVRLKSVDGQLRLGGKYPLNDGKLLFWILQSYNPQTGQVDISEFFEEYDAGGRMTAKRLLEMRVSFVEKARFEAMIETVGFKVLNLYGDYDCGAFDAETSLFMIWELGK